MIEPDYKEGMSSSTFHTWIVIAFVSFLVTSLLGVGLRYAFVWGFPDWIHYRNIQHTHSHIGMMGWIYGALFIFIVRLFDLNRQIYRRLFWLTQITLVGMLCSFPVQGYGVFSIAFTSLHLIFSYVFIFQVFRDLRLRESSPSLVMLRTSLILLFISTLGTWALGAIMNSPLKGTAWYYAAIQFFLHYQFNGWFVFAMIGLFFKYLEDKSIRIDYKRFKPFYWSLLISCILTFLLAVTWSTPTLLLFLINSIGVIIQLIALYFLAIILKDLKDGVKTKIRRPSIHLISLAFYLLALKILMQSLVALPSFAVISYTIRNFVIGFIHLLMLGVLTVFIFGLLREFRSVSSKLEALAIKVFLVAFYTTELLLFSQGLLLWSATGFIPGYYIMIFVASILFPVAITIYLVDLIAVPKIEQVPIASPENPQKS